MINQLYSALQQSFSPLQVVNLPQQQDDFNEFCNWLNHHGSNLQYVELKEYYDNGIEQCLLLQQYQVDIDALQNKIEAEIEAAFPDEAEEIENVEDQYIDFYDTAFDTLFDNIKVVADSLGLKLLVIVRENPYWMVVPNHEENIQQIIQAFNHVFAKDDLFLVEH